MKLSGGEKQRLAIARTILKQPNFIFLDEVSHPFFEIIPILGHFSFRQSYRASNSALPREIMPRKNFNHSGTPAEYCNRSRLHYGHGAGENRREGNVRISFDGRNQEIFRHADLLTRKGVYFNMWQTQYHQEKKEKEKTEEKAVDAESDYIFGMKKR